MAKQAGIETSLLDKLTVRAKQNGLEEQVVVDIIRSATTLAQKDLPYKQLFNKSYEGIAKGIEPGRIETKIVSIQENTIRAADLVDSWLEDDRKLPVQATTQEAIRSGLTIAISKINDTPASLSAAKAILNSLSIGAIPHDVGLPELVAAISTLPKMTRVIHSHHARKIIVSALSKGLPAEKIRQLPLVLHHARVQNMLPTKTMKGSVPGHLSNGFPVFGNPGNGINDFFPPNLPGKRPINR